MKILLVALAWSCVTACAPHRQAVKPPSIVRPNWAANETTRDHFNVVAATHQAAKEAEAELCSARQYVCVIQRYEAFNVERRRK